MYNKTAASRMIHFSKFIAIALGAFCLFLMPQSVSAQSGSINWSGWTFDYEIGVELDGVAIKNVQFQGNKIMERGSFPAMPVYYQNNQCGPYLDRLDGDLSAVSWANNDRVVSREFTVNGEQWYELGIRQFIGQYDIYQVWYFNGNGIVDAHLFSRGLQCQVFHEHYPHWRFDFDIGDSANDQILRQTSSGLQPYTNEFNVAATQAQDHGWVVRDTVSGNKVEINLDSGTWNVAGTVIPETTYANNRVAGRLHRNGEEDWGSVGHGSLPANWNGGQNAINYGNNENINGQDVVLWYSGYLPHTASEGSALWHSTGVRIKWSQGGTPPFTTPPSNETSHKFDFGTDASPVQSGWTQVTSNTNNNLVRWTGRGVNDFDRGAANGVDALNQDIIYGNGTSTLNFNVGNGTWRVTMVMGDRLWSRDDMVVKAESETINNNVDSAAGQFVYVGRGTSGGPQSFDVNVSDQVLNIELSDIGGGVNWSLTQLSLQKVDGSTPPPPPPSEPPLPPSGSPQPTFTHPDASYDGVSGDTIQHSSGLNVAANSSNFTVEFCIQPEQGSTGRWRAVVHKGDTNRDRTFAMWLRPRDMRLHYRISTSTSWNLGGDSVATLALNQPTKVSYVRDGNKLKLYFNGVLDSEATIGGSVVSNTGPLHIGDSPWYPGTRGQIGSFSLYDQAITPTAGSCTISVGTPPQPPTPPSQTTYNFDFGTNSSPVQSGWMQVSPSTNDSTISWSGARVLSVDRSRASGVDSINRDLVYGSGTTNLNLAVGNGTWRVTMAMGDASYRHDNMVVKAEGETINSDVDNAAGQFTYVGRGTSGGQQSFDVNVNDGVLNIELSDGGGSNRHWVLNSIQLERR